MLILKGSKEGVVIVVDDHMSFDDVISQLRQKLAESGDFFRGGAVRLESGDRRLSASEREAIMAVADDFGVEFSEIPNAGLAFTGIVAELPEVSSETHAGHDVSKRGASAVRSTTDPMSNHRELTVTDEDAYDGRPVFEQESVRAADETYSADMAQDWLGRTDFISDATLLLRRTVRSGQRIEFDGNVVVLGDVNAGAVVTCTGDIIVLGALRGVAHAGAEGNEDAIVVAFRLEPTQLRIAHYISRSPDEPVPGPREPEEARVRDGMIQIQVYVP